MHKTQGPIPKSQAHKEPQWRHTDARSTREWLVRYGGIITSKGVKCKIRNFVRKERSEIPGLKISHPEIPQRVKRGLQMNRRQTPQQDGETGGRTEQGVGNHGHREKALITQTAGLPKREGRKRTRDRS